MPGMPLSRFGDFGMSTPVLSRSFRLRNVRSRTHVNRSSKPMIMLQIVRLRARNSSRIVGQPDHWWWRRQFRRIEDPRHFFCMVYKGQRREMGRCVWMCSGGSLSGDEVVKVLRSCQSQSKGQEQRGSPESKVPR